MDSARSVRVLLAVGAAMAMMGLWPAPGRADGKGGVAVVVDPATNKPLHAGGSQTTWGLKVPAKSSCSGDSAHKGYYVYAYIASGSIEPARLAFNSDSGVNTLAGTFTFPLFDRFGSPFISRTTAVDTGQVLPGTVYTFNRLRAHGAIGGPLGPRVTFTEIPAGSYNVGMACWNANSNALDKVWNAQLTFVTNAADPNGLVWQAKAVPTPTSSSSGSSVFMGLGAIAVVGVGGVVVARRRSKATRGGGTR